MAVTRNTPQRRLVLSLMEGNYAHPTADEIYELAREKAPNISRGTVYRNLNYLADEGAIRKLPMPSGPDHYDCVDDEHYHFLCRKCHRVFDTPLEYGQVLDGIVPDMPGFDIESHRVILVGLCPDCKA